MSVDAITVYKSNLGWNIHIERLDEGWLHATPGAAADHLEQLRNDGHHIPQSAIDNLRKEGAS
ncbi:MAG: hypothetical protein K0S70_178 [Microbacterium sp.]|jgi:hypothetical protein|nr:hypothetical protein [Microbacterium sp.]